MFDESMLKQISDIAGIFASGFKKTKSLVDKIIRLNKDEFCESSDNQQTSNETQGTKRNENVENKTEKIMILNDDFEEYANKYFRSSRFLISRATDATLNRYFKQILQDRIRSDRFKNTWVHYDNNIPITNRKSWRKISEKQLDHIYFKLSHQFDEIKSNLRNATQRPDYMKQHTWKKREYILNVELPMNIWGCKQLRKFLTDNHAELVPLR